MHIDFDGALALVAKGEIKGLPLHGLWFVSKITSVRMYAAHYLPEMCTNGMLERVLDPGRVIHVRP